MHFLHAHVEDDIVGFLLVMRKFVKSNETKVLGFDCKKNSPI